VTNNKYFNLYNQKQEQKLVQELVEEAIKIHSINAVYIPRETQKIDPLFREDVLSRFTDHHHIEVYIKNVDGFDGDATIFKKFGLEIKNQVTLWISRSRFSKVFGKEMSRPKEGDLIYIPLSIASALFEIRFVKEDSVFYNLGEFYVFELQCEQYAFQDEQIDTGIDEIDEIADEGSQSFILKLDGGTGNFIEDEIIYQGESLLSATARATFIEKLSDTEIRIKDMFSIFDPTIGPIKGNDSGSIYNLTQKQDAVNITDDFGAKNKDFVVIDFTEKNPFSEPDESA
jgi:hypothetical protein